MIVKLKVLSMISLGENRMKQPLKEKLKQIGGGHLLNERDPATQADFDEDMGIRVGKIQQLKYSDWGKYISFNTGNNLVSLQKKELEAIFKIYKKYKSKIK